MKKEKILQLAKGFRGKAKNCISIARPKVEKALQHSYVDRKNNAREFRKLWILRINAATKEYGLAYSHFINGLIHEKILLNRKVLSELAIDEPHSFKALVDQVKFMRSERATHKAQELATQKAQELAAKS